MSLWHRKLAAWLHDPAEKALVLMRDSEDGKRIGHEQGSVARLRDLLGIERRHFDKRADWFAAAADRPQWPSGPDRPRWADVRWTERPVLVHPLSGRRLDLGKLSDVPPQAARLVSLDHFDALVVRDVDGAIDHRLTLLSFWRFGPTPPAEQIGALWQMLPADTRVPDHSIWQHLDAVSALAGALHDDAPALLTLAIGPVQGFISQARSTSDLWAGSHLLSSLAWEAMRPIVEALGPDAVLFPSLRGVPLVDLWLLEQGGEPQRAAWRERFDAARAPWLDRASDENPLFSAALPNKFTAIVPRSQARALAEKATAAVREAALAWALEAARKVFAEAGRDAAHAETQVREQLAGFPDVAWAAVDWPVDDGDNGLPQAGSLQAALAAFAAADESARPQGFFAGELWQLLAKAELVEQSFEGTARKRRTLRADGHDFFTANAGVLYPAVHALAEKSLAAAKACREFHGLDQRGYRCTMTGESEWLTDDRELLSVARGQRSNSVWAEAARTRQSWAKAGEHLGAQATLKRLWPTLFAERLERALGTRFPRRPLSTHALALAPSLSLLRRATFTIDQQAVFAKLAERVRDHEPALLPRALACELHADAELLALARRLPAALEALDDSGDIDIASRDLIHKDLATLLGHRHETYYAAIKLDGDRMGAWLAGDDEETRLRFIDTWHPQVSAEVEQLGRRDPALKRYVEAFRPASPARHMFVSAALNHFSQQVARHIVENICKGRLIYSGGDDVLALVALDDLLPALLLLRAAYSGDGDASGLGRDLRGLVIGRDHVMLDGRVLPTLGARATLSAGAVVAHHTAPLAHVLRCLNEAESVAKAAGRNRFRLRLMKRGGGEVALTARFWEPSAARTDPQPEAVRAPPIAASTGGFLLRLAQTLDATEFSRRAIYAATEWLQGLPQRAAMGDAEWRAMVEASLMRQFNQQGGLVAHAREAVAIACAETERAPQTTHEYLSNLLLVGEFFGRQRRAA